MKKTSFHPLPRAFVLISTVLLLSLTLPLCTSALKYTAAGTDGDTEASDTYKDSKYYTYLCDLKLTGDNPTDVLAVALSQLGYTESDTLDDLSGLANGTHDFTEYNLNFGDFSAGYSYYWCASFVSFCLLQSECHNYTHLKDWCRDHSGDKNYIWRELGCEKWRLALCDTSYFKTSYFFRETPTNKLKNTYDPQYTPSSGDLIFFTENNKTASHVGFVLYVDGGYVCTVEGNTTQKGTSDGDGNGVYIKKHKLTDSYILGYGDMPYKEDSTVRRIDYKGEHPTVGTYMSKQAIPLYDTAKNALSQNSTGRISTLPEYTMLNVLGIDENGTLRVSYAADGRMYTGHIKNAEGVIQLSSEILTLSIPKNGSNTPADTDIPSEQPTEDVTSNTQSNGSLSSRMITIVSSCVAVTAIASMTVCVLLSKKKNKNKNKDETENKDET